ncbi:flippase-like domain-containing protein [Candidatus Woesearchaeota archaeon]|nr:flippase-like domain-containing protein [Candidatus Woesearchaeota archaeon]
MKKILKIVFGIVFSAVLLIILFRIISLQDILDALGKISILTLLIAFLLYFLTYVFRAWRFKVMFKDQFSLSKMFSITCIHNFFNQLLPVRLGELSYIYFMGKEKNTGQATITLFLARFYDGITMVLFLVVSLIFVTGIDQLIFRYMMIAGVLLVVISISLIIIIIKRRAVLYLANRFLLHLKKIGLVKLRWIEQLKKFRKEMTLSIPRSMHLKIFLHSFLIWLISFAFFYTVISSLTTISIWKILVAGSLVNISFLIPIQAFANIGTAEGIWAIALIIVGIGKVPAISAGFVLHLLQIVFFTWLGLYGFAKRFFWKQ